MLETRFALTVDATDENTRGGLLEIQRRLQPLLTNAGDAATIELVLAEVLNNVVEHAYRDTIDGLIEIRFSHHPDRLKLHIIDQGVAMPSNRLPAGRLASLSVDIADLPEGGFGWHLINELTENLRYQRHNDENHLFFDIRYNLT